MSLFELELSKDFKIIDSIVFLNEVEFKKYYKLNSLNDGFNDNILQFIRPEYIFEINSNDLIAKRGFSHEEKSDFSVIETYVSTRITHSSLADMDIIRLFPEWLLFSIALNKVHNLSSLENEFEGYLDIVQYIAELRHKKYLMRNLQSFIPLAEWGRVDEYRNNMDIVFQEFLDSTRIEIDRLYGFLNFLYSFHQQLKENEKYKLMWNLETYIIETVRLLVDRDIDLKDIYLNVASGIRGTYSVLHEIYLYKPLYIEESKHYFESYRRKINDLFCVEMTIDEFMTVLISNKKCEDILFSYIELTKRFNGNKLSELLMGAMIKGIVLGLEENVKDFIKKPNIHFDKQMQELANDGELFQRLRIKDGEYSTGRTLLKKLNTLCVEADSIEKYLAVYYSGRNYLAHYNIDMEKFFWGEDRKRTVISNLLDAIFIILYKLGLKSERDEVVRV